MGEGRRKEPLHRLIDKPHVSNAPDTYHGDAEYPSGVTPDLSTYWDMVHMIEGEERQGVEEGEEPPKTTAKGEILTEKERRFLALYMADPRHNKGQAARDAGYAVTHGGWAMIGGRILRKVEKLNGFKDLLSFCNVSDLDLALKADELLNCGDKRIEIQALRLLLAVKGHLDTGGVQRGSTTINIVNQIPQETDEIDKGDAITLRVNEHKPLKDNDMST